MRLSASVAAVARTLRRPADLVPFYVVGTAVPAIARVFTFFGLVLVYLYLEGTGRIEDVRGELDRTALTPPTLDPESAAFAEWVTDLSRALEPAVTPVVVALIALTVVVTVLSGLVLYAGVSAGQLAACTARLRSERGSVAGIAGVRRYWSSFLGVYLLELLVWIGLTLAIALGTSVVSSVVTGFTGEPLVGVLLVFVGAFAWLVSVIVVRALFAFAPVAVVVDDVGAIESISNATGFVRRNTVEAVFYYVMSIVVLVGFGGLLSVLATVGIGSAVTLVTVLIVLPALDLLKTALYGDYRGTVSPPARVERSVRTQLSTGVRRGWHELGRFVRETPAIHAGIVVVALAGFWMGWRVAAPYDGVFEASIGARLEEHVPPTAAVEFFGNNWTVALTTAYAGVVLSIPAIVSIWFNGLVFGIYARLEVDPIELLTFVTPHGIFEIPAILVAGALGVHLGIAGWRTVFGTDDRATLELADELERAFWILVGVGLLLVIAGFIEGFVSPYYARVVF